MLSFNTLVRATGGSGMASLIRACTLEQRSMYDGTPAIRRRLPVPQRVTSATRVVKVENNRFWLSWMWATLQATRLPSCYQRIADGSRPALQGVPQALFSSTVARGSVERVEWWINAKLSTVQRTMGSTLSITITVSAVLITTWRISPST